MYLCLCLPEIEIGYRIFGGLKRQGDRYESINIFAAKFTSETELGEIEDWITLRNRMGPMPIPRKFEKVTKGYLRYVSQHDHSILMDSPFHEELPHHVQMKLENVVFHNLLIQFRFLKNLKNDPLAAHIVKDATTECFSEGDVLIPSGSFSKGIYLVLRGTVSVIYKKNASKPLDFYKRSNHVGEFCLLNLPAYFDYVAKTPVIYLLMNDNLELREAIRHGSSAWPQIADGILNRLEVLFLAKYAAKNKMKFFGSVNCTNRLSKPSSGALNIKTASEFDLSNQESFGEDDDSQKEDRSPSIEERLASPRTSYGKSEKRLFKSTTIEKRVKKLQLISLMKSSDPVETLPDVPQEPPPLNMLTYNKSERQVHPSKTTMALTSEGGQKTLHEPSLGVEHISLNHNLFSFPTSIFK